MLVDLSQVMNLIKSSLRRVGGRVRYIILYGFDSYIATYRHNFRLTYLRACVCTLMYSWTSNNGPSETLHDAFSSAENSHVILIAFSIYTCTCIQPLRSRRFLIPESRQDKALDLLNYG